MYAPLPGSMALYRADGSVEVVACGEADRVEKLVAWLKAGGPRSARVDKVLTEPHQPGREYPDFSIRY